MRAKYASLLVRCRYVSSSSSLIGTATLVGFGLLNSRWVFSAGRFCRVPLPAARQTPNLVPLRLKRCERTPAAEGGTMGEKW